MLRRLCFIAAFISIISSCTLPLVYIRKDPYPYSNTRIFEADFDATWSAIIKAIEYYPIITIEKDSGILLTDWVGGLSPNIFRTSRIEKETKSYRIGIKLKEANTGYLLVTDLLPGGPADQAGINIGDTIIRANNEEIATISQFNAIVARHNNPELIVRRTNTNAMDTIIVAYKAKSDTHLIPVDSKYRFNIRASKLNDNRTEVKVINFEQADFGHYYELNWISEYKFVETANIREKEILDNIEMYLNSRKH